MPATTGPKMVAEKLPGYRYGAADAPKSPVSVTQLEQLKQSAGLTKEDERYLGMAGEVLGDQTKPIVEAWRAIIGDCPDLR